ncbi:4-hydroxybenzoate polyprenyl transferase [Lactifluus volemus]|nr:4-hydroxybenzoate polyprenyl transferase [Lactifluus volemus]
MTASKTYSTGLWRWVGIYIPPSCYRFAEYIKFKVELSRAHRFAGSMLIFWPFAWGMTMAARPLSLSLETYALNLAYGLFGSALLHSKSAGCVWNDILDRGFDRQVERTKRRPIADGRVSVPGAVVFLWMQLAILVALLWPTNPLAWNLGLITVFPLAGLYPLMKRLTYWPQAWLGVAMNSIALVAWSALHSKLSHASGALMVGCWSWTLYYDTIYALQDKRDDLKAGVKSTAILFGDHVKTILAFFAVLLLVALTAAGVLNGQGMPYFAVTLRNLDVDDTKSCFHMFEANAWTLGEIVWAGLFADYLLV